MVAPMLAPARTRRVLLVTAILGVASPIATRFVAQAGTEHMISRVMMLGVLGVVPLTLAVLPSGGPSWDRLLRVAAWIAPACALGAVVGLWVPRGFAAGAWTAPWMGFSLLVAMLGASRLFQPKALRDPVALCSAAALLYLPIGAGWLVVSRMGLRPMGLDPMVVTLTAVHFHFAALAGPAMAARVTGALSGSKRRLAAAAGLAVVAAQPIVAVGISASPAVAFAGAAILALALLGLAALMLGWVQRGMRRAAARVLLVISGISLALSMPLAVIYAWGQVQGAGTIDLEWMIRLHGYANAHGFVTCGLLAWALEDRARG